MRNYITLFFLGLLFIVACESSKPIPPDVIPKKQMIRLLTEIHVLDGTMYNYPQNQDTLYKKGISRYLELFKAYHTDTTQFKRSMKFYTSQNVVFDEMYDQVMVNMNAKVDSLNNIRKKHAKADSIRNVTRFKKTQDSVKQVEANKAKRLNK